MMSNVIEITDFKHKKLAEARSEFDFFMKRAEEFTREGRYKFAGEMLERAKRCRDRINRYRDSLLQEARRDEQLRSCADSEPQIIYDITCTFTPPHNAPAQTD